jgi:hypothetical protein
MRPVLLLELNEIPLRIWKHYAGSGRFPAISRMLSESFLLETKIVDSGELSPWSTWPTFHRGLSNDQHGIFHLGQDPTTFKGVPIWEEYRKRGHSVGVFGSLQSWPPRDPGANGFYLPDTFSPDERCFPASLEPLQSFNLSQVRANARVMNSKVVARPPDLQLLRTLIGSGVRLKTLFRILRQLVAERFQSSLRERRVSFQALLFWDVFRALFNATNPPAFSTFFTNHVASVMHRYWNHIFPEDFPESFRPHERKHLPTMDYAMGVIEEILEEVFQWRGRNPELLVLVANSMGQAAILRDAHEGFEFLLQEPLKLLGLLKAEGGARQNLAMMPQVSLEFSCEEEALRAETALREVKTLQGAPLLSFGRKGPSLSITALTPKAKELERGLVLVAGREISIKESGFVHTKVTAGTAYHIPEGIIFALGLKDKDKRPNRIDATDAKALILDWAGLLRSP